MPSQPRPSIEPPRHRRARRAAVALVAILGAGAASADPPAAQAPRGSLPTTAQDTVDIPHVMAAFHAAVVGHDGARLAALFIPEGSAWLKVLTADAYARLQASAPGTSKIALGSYQEFARFVSSTRAQLDPRHSHVQIHTDGTIGSAYFDFVFLIDGVAQNRGSETWQLVRGAAGWRIAALTYSSEPPAK
jgi:hypothetical protein